MSLQTLYDAPTLTISYDHVNNWLYLDWDGAVDDELVMEGAPDAGTTEAVQLPQGAQRQRPHQRPVG